jgi:hypothetical protein
MHEKTALRPPAPPPADGFVWWCGGCRRTGPFTAADLARFAQAGWPACCGRKVFCHFADGAPG